MENKRNPEFEINGICKWKNKLCGECKDSDPFTTENYCHVAARLYIANENTLCTECKSGYLKINKEHSFVCSFCGHVKNFTEFI